MEPPQNPTLPPPSLPTPTPTPTTLPPTTLPPPTHPDSLDSSPRSFTEETVIPLSHNNNTNTNIMNINNNNNNNGHTTSSIPTTTTTTTTTAVPPQPTGSTTGVNKLRLMCSYGGHIVPRPHDKSLCYVGGDTRMVVVDRHITLSELLLRLTKILTRSSSYSTSSLSYNNNNNNNNIFPTISFTLKYQLPTEDLDSLISVTTDEDLENMVDEYERLNVSNSTLDVGKMLRIRLFLFPAGSVSSVGSLLDSNGGGSMIGSIGLIGSKGEDWFLNALNGTVAGFSDTSSSVNCLLGLEDDVAVVAEKKDVVVVGKDSKDLKGNGNGNNNNMGQDVHSVPDLERSSSFGSACSSPSLANLPPIRVHVDDGQKTVGGLEEQFNQMSIQQQHQKIQVDGGYVVAPAPVVVASVPLSTTPRVLSEDERSENSLQLGYQNNQQQFQQKQTGGCFEMASTELVSSDGRQKPAMVYQDQLLTTQTSNNSNRVTDMNNMTEQNTRIQMQQQQVPDSAYVMSMANAQVDPQGPQHPQVLHQQPQFIHTAVPQPQYIHHHPSGAVPMTSYYQMYPPQTQRHPHPHHQPVDQPNFVYYMSPMQAPHGYNMQMQPQAAGNQAPPSAYTTTRVAQVAPKSEIPVASQFVQVPSGQHQPQPQYVGYSQIHHTPQSVANSATGAVAGANYGYEFAEPAQGQPFYYAAQPLPPQSGAQYQTMTAEAGSYLPAGNSPKQQGRTQQP